MKSKLYILMLCFSIFCTLQNLNAQGVRYHDMIFDSVSITTVTYSDTFNLAMDIYQPVGDSACVRPVLVLAHGGTFVSGTRSDDNTVVTLCNNFAKRGYVTVSIDYRLGNLISFVTDSTNVVQEVLQAISDAKASVRWLNKSVLNGNPYRIDSNYIYCGGNSAGAVLFMQYIYIENISQVPSEYIPIINNNGGLEGNSGNPGYSSKVMGVLSGAGGLNEPSFLHAGSKPIIHFQGDQDATVPYYCADAESGAIAIRLCGLGSLDPIYQSTGMIHASFVFPGDGHVPWATDAGKLMKVDTNSANFFDTLSKYPTPAYCSLTGIDVISEQSRINVFPVPALNVVNVALSEASLYAKVQLIDPLGRTIEEKPAAYLTTFNRGNLATGVYFVRAVKKDSSAIMKKVILE